jgi:hypothetical protein
MAVIRNAAEYSRKLVRFAEMGFELDSMPQTDYLGAKGDSVAKARERLSDELDKYERRLGRVP